LEEGGVFEGLVGEEEAVGGAVGVLVDDAVAELLADEAAGGVVFEGFPVELAGERIADAYYKLSGRL
jgi:hypothetical protein